MFVNFNILNQLGSPAINSNTFANRPAAGQTGRLFVSTDTFEIYRDNGTTWDLIGGPGSSTITGTGTATQVAYFTSSQAIGSSANLYWDNTNNRLGINTATPGAALDIHGTGTIQQINSTSATANSLLAFQRSGTGLWRIGDNYNAGSNYFELYNTVLGTTGLQLDGATNKAVWQSQQTYSTGLARANYFDYNLSVAAGGSFSSPNSISAVGATLDLTLAGNATIPSGARSGLDAYNTISFTGSGTLTQGQGSQIRAYSNLTTGWAFAGSSTGTITHLAGLRVLFPDNSGSAVTITNNYGLLINDQTANTGTVTYTNRWGIYQEGASDLNYFAANMLIGSTVNNGNKLQVTGNGNLTGDLTADAYYLNGMTAGNGALYWVSDRVTIANYNASGTVVIETGGGAAAVTFAANQAATFTSSVTATSLIKTGGLSTQYLMADGSTSTLTNPVTGTGTANYIPKFTSSSAIGNSNLQTDASGNLGLGVTPSAWGFITPLQIKNSTFGGYTTGTTHITYTASNWYLNGSGVDTYIANGAATLYSQSSGQHAWFNAPSGTAGNTISFTQAMTLTAAGRLGIGTTNPSNNFVVSNGGAAGFELGVGSGSAAGGTLIENYNRSTGNYVQQRVISSDYLFETNAGVAINIPSNRNVLIGTTTDAGQKLQVAGTASFTGNVQLGTVNSAAFTIYRSAYTGNLVQIYAELSAAPIIRTYTTSDGMGLILNQYEAVSGSPYTRYADIVANTSDSSNSILRFFTKPFSANSALALTLTAAQNAEFTGSIKTGAPTGGTAAAWKLGSRVATSVTLDTTQYIEVDIGGTAYKLAIVTPA